MIQKLNIDIKLQNKEKKKLRKKNKYEKTLEELATERKLVRQKRENGSLSIKKADEIEEELNKKILEQNRLSEENLRKLNLVKKEIDKREVYHNRLTQPKLRKVMKSLKRRVQRVNRHSF
jgi:hypothetical protein